MDVLKAKVFPKVLAGLLWLVSFALGLLDVYFIWEIFRTLYVKLGGRDAYLSYLLGNCLLGLVGFGYLAFVIVSSEYHLKHLGEAPSWKLFAKTIGVQLIFPIVAFFTI
jgi:hypothetical protein